MTTDDALSCPQCHLPAVPGAAFCEECGARLEAPPAPVEETAEAEAPPTTETVEPAPEPASKPKSRKRKKKPADVVLLAWDATVPMVGDRFFMWDMAKLWAISCSFLLILSLVLAAVEQSIHMLKFSLIVPPLTFVGFYIFSLLIALVFFLNKYYVQTVISERGVKFELVRWTGKLSKAVAAGNIVIGLLKNSPTAVGAGVLANVQRVVFMKWPEIRKVTFFPGQRVMTLSNSWRPVVRLHCPDDEIYEKVRVLLEAKVPEGGGTLSRS